MKPLRSLTEIFLGLARKVVPVKSPSTVRRGGYIGVSKAVGNDPLQSESLLGSIFSELPIGLSILRESDLAIIAINPAFCKMLEYEEGQLIGRPIADFVDERDRSVLVPVATLHQEIAPVSKRYRGQRGGVVHARTRRIRLTATDSNERIILNITEDISRELAIEAALLRSQRLEVIGTLTGGIAHDFNNLLGVLMGSAETLAATVYDPPALEIVNEMIASVERGADLTGRLLSFARRQSLKPVTVNLNDYLPTHVRLLQRTMGGTIRVSAKLADQLWLVNIDPSQLADAILNLALNSKDAMPEGGILEIASLNKVFDEDLITSTAEIKAGQYVELSVTDTGKGIPPDAIPHVIEPFFSTKPSGNGTGLGLSMVYGFTRQSGGHLMIYSDLGRGTTIRIYLPRSERDRASPSVTKTTQVPTGNGEVILVVDDNDEMRMVAMRNLTALGYQVKSATDGISALAEIESNDSIALLFTDIVMPGGLSGYDLAEKSRKIRPNLPIILSTGFAKVDGASLPEERYYVIRKPYRRSDLAEQIRMALSKSHAG
jgi:PAS domain S-box-containing protein